MKVSKYSKYRLPNRQFTPFRAITKPPVKRILSKRAAAQPPGRIGNTQLIKCMLAAVAELIRS